MTYYGYRIWIHVESAEEILRRLRSWGPESSPGTDETTGQAQ